ncbi:MAG TPA: hypothetical protein VGP48_11885 [Stellaceae bacterium]|jgi:uncharacterized membrane protein YbjE (DUF340 family)|nr:hypothetical protein [Stellaceae bacterium]
MEPVIDKLLAVARPLLHIRACAWLAIIALSGFSFGLALRAGIAWQAQDVRLFFWVLVIGAAAGDMRASERRAEMRRRKKLDALYGRRF